MSKTDLDEKFLKGTVGAAIGRGAKRLARSAGQQLGMKSLDAVEDGQNARDKVTDDFLGFARQQGWGKEHYTMASLLSFISQRYRWVPDDHSMLKIAEFAKATWGKKALESVIRENQEFIRSAHVLVEAFGNKAKREQAQAQADYRLLNDLKAKGHLQDVIRAYKGEALDRTVVQKMGGFEVLQSALDAMHRSSQSPAAAAQPEPQAQSEPQAQPEARTATRGDSGGGDGGGSPPDGAIADDGTEEAPIGGTFSSSPAEHAGKWQKLQRILPGRDKVLTRGQMDGIATIIARDMLRRGLMTKVTKDEADGSPGGHTDRRNPSIDSVAPGTGSIVSIPYFLRYIKEAGVSTVSVKQLELIGAKHHINDVVSTALSDPNVGSERLYLIAAAYAMSLRLKREAKKSHDNSYDSNNRFIHSRNMVELLKQRGVSADTMTQFNDIGDASNNVRDVATSLRGTLGEDRLKDIMACFIVSIRFMNEQEKSKALKGDDEEQAAA